MARKLTTPGLIWNITATATKMRKLWPNTIETCQMTPANIRRERPLGLMNVGLESNERRPTFRDDGVEKHPHE